MKKQPKQGYLGPAFHEWLEWLEYVECVTYTEKNPGKPKYMAMNDKLFTAANDADFQRMMNDAAPVDAWLARCVRSSVKYKIDASTLALMTHQYEDELRYIRNTTPIHLPHEWVTLIVEGFGNDTFMMCLQETTTNHGKMYTELGVEGDEEWISANIMLHRNTGIELMDGKHHPEQKLSYVPVEQHFNKGRLWNETKWLNASAQGVTTTEEGKKALAITQGLIMAFIESFHLQSVLRHKTVQGVAPMPKAFVPKKRRKRREHPRFEHVVVELSVDDPESQQTGRSVFQPKKRMHQVRGFWRKMRKSGKQVWVKPHWRGDEALGVLRRDFEMTVHDEGDNNVNESKAIRREPAGQTDQSGRTGHRSVLRDGADSVWDRTRKALATAWVSVVRPSG